MRKISIAVFSISFLLSTNSVYAFKIAKKIEESFKKVIEQHKLEKQEFKPIIFDEIESTSFTHKKKEILNKSKFKDISLKNEFFQSIKLTLNSKNDSKIIYLNPYEKLDNIKINRDEEYKIKVFDLNEKYLGNLTRINLKKESLVKVSPFFIFPELLSKDTPLKNTEAEEIEEKKVEPKEIISEVEPKKINPLKPEPLEAIVKEAIAKEESPGNQFKVANISDFRVKVSIKKANGESIGTNWTIDNDVYTPEPLKFAAKPVVLEPDTKINITYLDKDDKIRTELSLPAKDIPKDHHNNYTYFIENIVSD